MPNFDLAASTPTVAERQPCCLSDTEIVVVQAEPPQRQPQMGETASDALAKTTRRCHAIILRPTTRCSTVWVANI